ncbi:hypothetical protein DK095_70006 [Flavobacterium psychrophilum]|nr:hypothetical protein FI146_130006 [Flavobacterium psychrophilum]SNA87572.1 hypothetical protein DK095_70006 [Flavobacterium psychrophilum]SNB04138.1 hypothetical protein JIP1600_10006 [Flavobacterium psychrophilum]
METSKEPNKAETNEVVQTPKEVEQTAKEVVDTILEEIKK